LLDGHIAPAANPSGGVEGESCGVERALLEKATIEPRFPERLDERAEACRKRREGNDLARGTRFHETDCVVVGADDH
jgi:hypothetical protein